MLPLIKDTFRTLRISTEILLTKNQGHGLELAAQADFSAYDGIIAAGGDGTLYEVINGYYKNRSVQRIPVGVLPTGTGNAFAKELDLLKNDWEKAIRIIAAGKTKKVDVGQFTSNGEKHYFVNILGFGFVGDVNKTAQRFKWLGDFAYTIGVLYQILFLKTFKLSIKMDDISIERENIFVEISNTRYTGTTFLMAPEADVADGLLNITLLNKINRREILKIFPTIFDGSHINQKQVETFTAKQIRVETQPVKVLTPDGELFGSTPIEVSCLKQDMEFFWPSAP